MLTLVAGAATGVIRRALVRDLLDTQGASGTVLVVPDEVWSANLTQTLAAAANGLRRQAVFSLPELLDYLRPPETRLVVEPRERLVVLRSILHANPPAFDRLVGERSAPHLTQGVLQRIADATLRALDREALAAESGEEPAPPTARVRQLLKLGREYVNRLEQAGAIDRRIADREACLAIDATLFARMLPDVERIAFVGFDSFDDLTLLAMRRLRDAVGETFTLLNFDPAEDTARYHHLAESYPRVFDLADQTLLDAPGDSAAEQSTAAGKVRIVHARSRHQEARSMARYLRARLEQDAQAGRADYADYAVCVAAFDKYYPLLHEALEDYGLPVATAARVRVVNHPVVQLLEALRAAISSGRSLASIRQVLKSPFVSAVVGAAKDSPTGLSMVQVLDRLRRDGNISGDGNDLLREVRNHLGRLRTQLETAQHAEIESAWAARLPRDVDDVVALEQLLVQVFELMKALEADATLAAWPDRLEGLLAAARTAVSSGDARAVELYDGAVLALREAAHRVSLCSPLLGSGEVSFVSYVGMLRVVLGSACIEQPAQRGSGIELLDRAEVRGLRPRVLIMCGMVDGDFPQYAQREASLEEEGGTRPNQQANLARQRYLFDQLLKSAREEVLLFVPEADDGAELLESQFVEDLVAGAAPGEVEVLRADDFCSAYTPEAKSGSEAIRELSRCLQVQLDLAGPEVNVHGQDARATVEVQQESTESLGIGVHGQDTRATVENVELPPLLQNIVWNVAANYERARPDALGMFDGYVQDEELLKFLRHRLLNHVHSVSQLDILVQCPFRYMTEIVMKLEELEEPEDGIDPRDLGKLAHDILFRFMTEWVERGHGPFDAGNRAEALKLLYRHGEAALQEEKLTDFSRDLLRFKLFGSQEAGLVAGRAAKDAAARLRDFPGLLAAFVDLEIARTENSGGALLRPTYFEMGFGLRSSRHRDERDEHSVPDAVELELGAGGEKIRLRGRADRVDVGPQSFAIVDYKTGAAPSIKDQTEGFRVQIPAYLMALEQIFKSRGQQLDPAGGVFYALGADGAEMTGQFFRKEARAEGGLGARVRTLDEDAFSAAMDLVRWRIADGLQRVREGRFHVTVAGEKVACNYCGSAGICRKDLDRAARLVPMADALVLQRSNSEL